MESLFGKKTPQPFPGGEPDTEEGWRLQEERIKKEAAQEAANKPGVLSTISDTFNSFFGKKEGGRKPKKSKKNKPKKPKQTKNKRR